MFYRVIDCFLGDPKKLVRHYGIFEKDGRFTDKSAQSGVCPIHPRNEPPESAHEFFRIGPDRVDSFGDVP